MKKHTEIYLKHFNYHSFIPCEICGKTANDIHHIECRGMGGSKNKNDITNLMALCRQCHIDYGDKKQYKELLKEIHNKCLKKTIHSIHT